MSNKYINTLDYYGYGENNRMTPALGKSYKVKVSDKDGNIITIEKDDSLYACVKLSFDANSGVLQLLDVAHEDSVLAEVEMPNADYIYNCRFDEELNAILFDVKSLYGDKTDTIELDVESLVEIYEAGQGIEIGNKNDETGRKPISIKLAEGESLLQLTDEGLGIDDDAIITTDELDAAISGKADASYVDEAISEVNEHVNDIIDSLSGITGDVTTITDRIDKIEDIIGTDIDDPDLNERIDSKADLDEFNDLEEEVGEIETNLNILSGLVLDNEVSIEKVDEGFLPENVKEAFVLKNSKGETLGERINIYKDSSLKSVEKVGEKLIFTYILADGTEQVQEIDFSEVVIEAEFKDGLQVNNGEVSVKIDETSDGYLTVSEDGVKLSGVFQQFTDLISTNTSQWEAINGEVARAAEVERQLWGGINGEAARAAEVEGQLWAANGAREQAEESLSESINSEIVRAIAAENELRGLISGDSESIEGLSERITQNSQAIAQNSEHITQNSEAIVQNADAIRQNIQEIQTNAQNIASEASRAISAETDLQTVINAEETRASNKEQELYDSICTNSGSINTLSSDLVSEHLNRISVEEGLSQRITVIEEDYATKVYVDDLVERGIETAISSATAGIDDKIDSKINTAEAELKQYCDSGNTELQSAISENTTRINGITNDSKTGTLDALHTEFHNLTDGITDSEMIGLIADMLRRIDALEQRL